MENIRFISKEIETDIFNIQTLVDMLADNDLSKGHRRSIEANIKVLVKTVHNSKCLIEDKMFDIDDKVKLPLFEIEPSPVTILEEYNELSSFFGSLEN